MRAGSPTTHPADPAARELADTGTLATRQGSSPDSSQHSIASTDEPDRRPGVALPAEGCGNPVGDLGHHSSPRHNSTPRPAVRPGGDGPRAHGLVPAQPRTASTFDLLPPPTQLWIGADTSRTVERSGRRPSCRLDRGRPRSGASLSPTGVDTTDSRLHEHRGRSTLARSHGPSRY